MNSGKVNERKNAEKEANHKERKKQNKETDELRTLSENGAVAPRDSEIDFVDEDRSLFVQGTLYYLHSFEHLLLFEPPPDYLNA